MAGVPEVGALFALSPRAQALLDRLKKFVEVGDAPALGVGPRARARTVALKRADTAGRHDLRGPGGRGAQEECVPAERVFEQQHRASADRWTVRTSARAVAWSGGRDAMLTIAGVCVTGSGAARPDARGG